MAKRDKDKVPTLVSGKGKGRGSRSGKSALSSARKGKIKGDNTSTIIGIVAIVVVIGIVAWGISSYSSQSYVPEGGYGDSVSSVASVGENGVITVSNGTPKLELDVYEDAICPICADLEHQFGEQMAKAVDDGQLTLNFKMVDFLNEASASKDYSTRAVAALRSVAEVDGDKPGVWMAFHSALYDSHNQPRENGSKDLSNDQLADLAGDAGASEEAQKRIADGVDVEQAAEDAKAHMDDLRAAAAQVGRNPGTPTVALDGIPISTQSSTWLTDLLAEYAADSDTE